MPLTDDGWQAVTKETALINRKASLQKYFGGDIDVSDGSFFGILANYLADDDVEKDSAEQESYNNTFWNSATGVSMDRLASQMNIQRHQAQYATVSLSITGNKGYVISAGTEFLTDNGDSYLSDEDVQIDQNGNATVNCHSLEASADGNVDAHTIINQANPVDDVVTVDNPNPAIGGADLETDYDFRNRGNINQRSPEGPTANGIRTALINVNGVENAVVRQDTDGVHAYVAGGSDDDIAYALANNLAGGATSLGKITKDVAIDNSGQPITVSFDRAEQVIIRFKIDITKDSSGYDEDAVKQAVQNYINDFEMGQEVIFTKIYQYLYQLTGVSVVNDASISKDGNNFSASNISLSNYQVATTNDNSIEVNAHD